MVVTRNSEKTKKELPKLQKKPKEISEDSKENLNEQKSTDYSNIVKGVSLVEEACTNIIKRIGVSETDEDSDNESEGSLKGFTEDTEEIEQGILLDNSDIDFENKINSWYEYDENVDEIDYYDTPEHWKELPKKTLDKLKQTLDRVIEIDSEEEPSIIKILESNISDENKVVLLNRFHIYKNSEPSSEEKYIEKVYINSFIKDNEIQDQEKYEMLIEKENKLKQVIKSKISLKQKILSLDTTESNLAIFYEKYIEYSKMINMDSERQETERYLNFISNFPFGKYVDLPVTKSSSQKQIESFIHSVKDTLDSRVAFLDNVKEEIISLAAQMITNPNSCPRVIGVEGDPGVGKTRLIKETANALKMAFTKISLGGQRDGNMLGGDRSVWIGSKPGKIIEEARRHKLMNFICYFDEVDKISTEKNEIWGVLTHLIDNTQIKEFSDEYFPGVTFDLSRIIWFFAYNQKNLLDQIVGDRIYKLKVDSPTFNQKIKIAQQHLIPELLQNVGFKKGDIVFSDEIISSIISRSQIIEKGCRQLRSNIETIIMRINTLRLSKSKISLSYSIDKKLLNLPITISFDILNSLFYEPIDTSNEAFKNMLT